MTDTAAGEAPTFDWIDYGEFGARFFRRAVTQQRVADAVGGLAGRGLRFEPLKTGPLGLAELSVRGEIGKPSVTAVAGELVSFAVEVPIEADLLARFGHEVRVHGDIVINLVLVARAADPLLVVIDVPPVRADMVRLNVRADGMAGTVVRTMEPLLPEVRRQVAGAVNALLNSGDAVRRRVIDVAARLADEVDEAQLPRDFSWLSYAEFGERFIAGAVTPQRLEGAMAELDGRPITIGPFRTGPKDRAEVRADGTVGTPAVRRRDGDLVSYDVALTITLDLVIDFLREHRYRASIVVNLVLVAHAADPLLIVVDIAAVTADDVDVSVVARGVTASALQVIGGIGGRIKERVVVRVNEELADSSGRVIDVGARIDAG